MVVQEPLSWPNQCCLAGRRLMMPRRVRLESSNVKQKHRRDNENVFLGYVWLQFRGLRRPRNTGPKTEAKIGFKTPRKAWAPTVGAHTFVPNLRPLLGSRIRPRQRDPLSDFFSISLSGPDNRDCVLDVKFKPAGLSPAGVLKRLQISIYATTHDNHDACWYRTCRVCGMPSMKDSACWYQTCRPFQENLELNKHMQPKITRAISCSTSLSGQI